MVIIRNNADINTLTAPDRYFGNMIVAAPTWFTDEYLGIEIEQYIGFGLLAIIITVVHFTLLKLIDMNYH